MYYLADAQAIPPTFVCDWKGDPLTHVCGYEPTRHPIVSLAEFNRVRRGMVRTTVNQLFGYPGESISPDVAKRLHGIEDFVWRNPDNSRVYIRFQNDRVSNLFFQIDLK